MEILDAENSSISVQKCNINQILIACGFLDNCRFCLKKLEAEKISITQGIFDQFYDLTKIQLNSSDIGQYSICRNCCRNLTFSCNFKNQLIDNQTKLLKTLTILEKSGPNNIPNEAISSLLNDIKLEDGIEEFLHKQDQTPNTTVVDSLKFEGSKEHDDYSVDFEITNLEEKLRKKSRKPRSRFLSKDRVSELTKKQKNYSVLCQECGQVFRRDSLKIHIDRVHKKLKRFSCDLCGYQAYLKTHIRNHMSSVHTKQRNFQCKICLTWLPSPSALASHKLFKHTETRNYKCTECSKSFKRKRLLNDHIRIIHRKEKPFLCEYPECHQTFAKKVLLENHRMKHYQEPTLPCEKCGKLYYTIYNLQKHLVTHQEPQFTCDICQKQFYKKYNWQIHIKTHTGNRDFKCEYCDMSYYKKDHLNRHLLNVHTKLKLKCEVQGCSSQFARKESYKKHIQKNHNNMSEECLKNLLAKIRSMK